LASAAGEHRAIASSSVAVTVRMRSKRLMAKISATTLCNEATRSGASPSRIFLAAIMRTRRPTLLMYSIPEKSSTRAPFSAAAAVTSGVSADSNSAALRWSMRPTGMAITASATWRVVICKASSSRNPSIRRAGRPKSV
jgi:hypothetical protein